MAVKTTKIQCNQDVDLRGKVDVEGKLTCGGDAEFDGVVTINSAKDLKTKDGTEFATEEYVTIDISDINMQNLPYEKNVLPQIGEIYNNGHLRSLKLVIGDITIFTAKPVLDLLSTAPTDGAIGYAISSFSAFGGISVYVDYDSKSSKGTYSRLIISKVDYFDLADVQNLINNAVKDKQVTLYRHTIDIDAGGLGLHTYVTALSEKNTVIDSVQDLVAVFGNTKLMATGMFGNDNDATAMLEVGTTMLNTYVHSGHGSKLSLSDWANYGPDESRLVITDTVTAM